jgi:purine nucleosidase
VGRRGIGAGISVITGLIGLGVAPAVSAGSASAAVAPPVPVVFDTDMDFDDAAALAYLSREHKAGRIDLRAVTVTNSGAGLPGSAIRNARCLLHRFGLGHVPVADGSPTAPNATPPELRLNVELVMATVLLGCLQGTHPAPVSAAALLVDTIRRSPTDVVLIATGPLSNVAAALQLDAAQPSSTTLQERIAATYVMGGAVGVPGNICCTTTVGFDGSQELNMWIDPPAAQRVLEAFPANPVFLVPLDATRYVPVTAPFAQRLNADQRTAEAQVVAAIANHPLISVGSALGQAFWWDPLAAMAAVRPGVVSYQDHPISVVQAGAQAGRTALAVDGRAVHVGVFADQAGFEQRFIDTLNGRST